MADSLQWLRQSHHSIGILVELCHVYRLYLFITQRLVSFCFNFFCFLEEFASKLRTCRVFSECFCYADWFIFTAGLWLDETLFACVRKSFRDCDWMDKFPYGFFLQLILSEHLHKYDLKILTYWSHAKPKIDRSLFVSIAFHKRISISISRHTQTQQVANN